MFLGIAEEHGKGCAVAMAPVCGVPRLAEGAVVPVVHAVTPEHRCAEAASGGTQNSARD